MGICQKVDRTSTDEKDGECPVVLVAVQPSTRRSRGSGGATVRLGGSALLGCRQHDTSERRGLTRMRIGGLNSRVMR